MEAVSIERVTTLPTADLTPLVAESERSGWRFLRRLLDDWTSGANRFNGTGEALFAARADGHLVGVCGVNVDPYLRDGRVGRLRRLYVAADRRGSGIGRRLVERVVRSARETFDQLRVRTDSTAAAQFYEALGFERRDSADCTHVLDLRRADAPPLDKS